MNGWANKQTNFYYTIIVAVTTVTAVTNMYQTHSPLAAGKKYWQECGIYNAD